MIPSPVNFVDRAAVTLHHLARAFDQLGHDLAHPLRTDGSCDAHGVHHICEQHRHLIVLGDLVRLCNWGTTLIAELRVVSECRRAASSTGCRGHVIAPAKAM